MQLPARVGVADGAESMTLEAAIRLTLEQNNDVEVARLEISGARQLVRAAEGVFDPRIIPNFSYERANTANASSLGGATQGRVTQKELFGGIQFAGRSPRQGGEFAIDFTQTRLETSNQFSRLNPQFPSRAELQLHAAAVARSGDRSGAASDPAVEEERRPHRFTTAQRGDRAAHVRRAGLLGPRVREPQPRSADERAGAGARPGGEQRASGARSARSRRSTSSRRRRRSRASSRPWPPRSSR